MEATREAKSRGVLQLVVVCLAKDVGKRRLLADKKLNLVCGWHFRRL